jgi:hypothetical protein
VQNALNNVFILLQVSISILQVKHNFIVQVKMNLIICATQATIVPLVLSQQPLIHQVTHHTQEWVMDVQLENIALKELPFLSNVLLDHTVLPPFSKNLLAFVPLVTIAQEVLRVPQPPFVPEDITVKQDQASLYLAWVVPTTKTKDKIIVPMLVFLYPTAGGQSRLHSTMSPLKVVLITEPGLKSSMMDQPLLCMVNARKGSTARREAHTLTRNFVPRVTSALLGNTMKERV